jgi:hypothetical protein
MGDFMEENLQQKYKNIFSKEPLPKRWGGFCFGCSIRNENGLKLEFWPIDKGCISKYKIADHYCGFDKVAHGGIIATLLDEVAAWAIARTILAFGVTIDAHISYFKPVPTNQEIILEANVVDSNDKHVETAAYIKNMKGNILARCKSNWLLPNYEQFSKMANIKKDVIEEMIGESLKSLKIYLDKF